MMKWKEWKRGPEDGEVCCKKTSSGHDIGYYTIGFTVVVVTPSLQTIGPVTISSWIGEGLKRYYASLRETNWERGVIYLVL